MTTATRTTRSNGATRLGVIAPVSNDGAADIDVTQPYTATITVEGTAAFLFHRWSVEAVAEKAAAAKGSKAKKTDNVESYVYRDDKGHLAIPAEYFRQAIIGAARFRQDPRSPRSTAQALFKAGVHVLNEYASLGVRDWDYTDRRRVAVQRAGVTRVSKEPELCSTCGEIADECRLDQVDEWVCPTCADNQNAPIQSAGSAWDPW